MALSTTPNTEGKGKAIGMCLIVAIRYSFNLIRIESPSGSDSSTSESSDSSSSEFSDSDSDDPVTHEYLESLLDKARKSYAAAAAKEKIASSSEAVDEEIITLDEDASQKRPLPLLDPGVLPSSYFELGASRFDGPSKIGDPDIESAARASSSRAVPTPPIAPPELTKSGKPLTRKEKKELKNKTAGSDWFDLPAPAEADLPRLHREVEALRLRNQLDPKRFYRKDEGEGKGIKGLPKYFAVRHPPIHTSITPTNLVYKIGTILPTSMPFGTASGENLTRANRKRTLVDELVDDAEAKRYAKRKFEDLQSVRGAKGRNTLAAKKAMRRPKW
ncbi:hypothetical protein DXG01_011934 [Tephrocybe rancida]|nr:hypothetical protein DXG01_011934 [Tephrocybe rancida]